MLSIDFDGNGGNDTLAVERDADNPIGDMGVDVPVDMYGTAKGVRSPSGVSRKDS